MLDTKFAQIIPVAVRIVPRGRNAVRMEILAYQLLAALWIRNALLECSVNMMNP
jgi:hypothetical protein